MTESGVRINTLLQKYRTIVFCRTTKCKPLALTMSWQIQQTAGKEAYEVRHGPAYSGSR